MACFSCVSKQTAEDESYSKPAEGSLELSPIGIHSHESLNLQSNGGGDEIQPLTETKVKTRKSGNTVTVVKTTRTRVVNIKKGEQISSSQTSPNTLDIPAAGINSRYSPVSIRSNEIEETQPLTHTKVKRSKNGKTVTVVKTTRSRVVNTVNTQHGATLVIERDPEPGSNERVYKTTVEKTPQTTTRKRFNLKSVLLRRAKKEISPPIDVDDDNLQERCLQAHNTFRSMHGVKPLVLNKEMCDYAMDWAKHLAKKNKLKHRKKNKFGENLALGTGSTYNVENAVQSWYDEMEHYDYKNPGFSAQTGHFSQVVWQESSQLGVGVAKKNDQTWLVCNYDPPGNVMGQYADNVQRPKGRQPKIRPLFGVVNKAKPESSQDEPKPSTSQAFKKIAFGKKEKWTQFELECLESHNKRRALHGCAPLTLNRNLCTLANDWATHLTKIRTMYHRPQNDYGENIYQIINRDPTAEDAVKGWYDEIGKYKYSKPGFSPATGHFTQIVWLDTTEVGVGKAKVDNITFIVCNYNPPGNVMTQYKAQVPPLGGFKQNKKDCSHNNNNADRGQTPGSDHSTPTKKSNFFTSNWFKSKSKAK